MIGDTKYIDRVLFRDAGKSRTRILLFSLDLLNGLAKNLLLNMVVSALVFEPMPG